MSTGGVPRGTLPRGGLLRGGISPKRRPPGWRLDVGTDEGHRTLPERATVRFRRPRSHSKPPAAGLPRPRPELSGGRPRARATERLQLRPSAPDSLRTRGPAVRTPAVLRYEVGARRSAMSRTSSRARTSTPAGFRATPRRSVNPPSNRRRAPATQPCRSLLGEGRGGRGDGAGRPPTQCEESQTVRRRARVSARRSLAPPLREGGWERMQRSSRNGGSRTSAGVATGG